MSRVAARRFWEPLRNHASYLEPHARSSIWSVASCIRSFVSVPARYAAARCTWKAEEDNLLRELKSQGKTSAEIWKAFPQRTSQAIRERVHLLDSARRQLRQAVRGPPRPWSRDEEELLRERHTKGTPWFDMMPKFPGRSLQAIVRHYHDKVLPQLHNPHALPKHAVWSAEEVDLLVQLRDYENRTFSEIASTLGRSHVSTRSRYYKHTASPTRRRRAPPGAWTTEETKLAVGQRHVGRSYNEIAMLLGNRTAMGVQCRLSQVLRMSGRPRSIGSKGKG